MLTIRQRAAMLALSVTGVLATAVLALAACPSHGGPAGSPSLPPPAPACTAIGAPCPPWAQ